MTELAGVRKRRERNAEYEDMYRDNMPELEMVMWKIKADDRDLCVDEH